MPELVEFGSDETLLELSEEDLEEFFPVAFFFLQDDKDVTVNTIARIRIRYLLKLFLKHTAPFHQLISLAEFYIN